MNRQVLRRTLLAVSVFSIALLCACSEDSRPLEPNDPEIETPAARLRFTFGGGVYTQPLEFVRFIVSYPDEPGSPSLGPIEVRDGDEGRVIEFDASTSASVEAFLALANNGTEESLFRNLSWGGVRGGSVGGAGPESERFRDRNAANTGPDLAETPVSRAVMTFERADVKCPGSDPNGDGLWADLWVTVEVSFYGAKQ